MRNAYSDNAGCWSIDNLQFFPLSPILPILFPPFHSSLILLHAAAGDDSFAEILADAVRIEVSADLTAGIEGNCIDNFVLLTSDSPPLPATMTANPPLLEFPGVAGVAKGVGAGAQILLISSGGGSLRWEASVSGALAERVTLSETTGDTPSTVFVRVDSAGLPAGTFEGRVTITALGTPGSRTVSR